MLEEKNTDGSKGKICNNCGGYGYTLGIRQTHACQDCGQTGIARTGYMELIKEVQELRKKLNGSDDS